MIASLQKTKAIFRDSDIEGLIGNGAPDNEYDPEAVAVYEAISHLPENDITEDHIVAIISLVWARMFNRDEAEIKMRLPAFTRTAKNLLVFC